MPHPIPAEPQVLLLPGWYNSGPGHWQTLWEQRHGHTRVEQHDWQRPLRGDWSARLEEAVLAARTPVVLAAHSLGCLLVAAWAAHSRHTQRVQAALLVAPPDVAREDLAPHLPGWSPPVLTRLPFRSTVVCSRNDPFSSPEHTRTCASAWGATLVDAGESGHLNAEAGLGDWPEGLQWLHALMTPKD